MRPPLSYAMKRPVHTARHIRYALRDVVDVDYGQCSLKLAVHPTSCYEANNEHKGFR